jgi:hypothetical protein
MARLFNISGVDIVLDPTILAVPAFKKIWNRDKSKGKEQATLELSYIVFLCDYSSPYKDLHEDIKEQTIIKDLFKKEWKPDEDVRAAIEKYNQLKETRHLKMLRSYEHIEDQITSYNNRVNLEEKDDFGRLKYDINDIVKSAEKIGSIIKSISILEKQVQTEIAESSNVRGQSEIGPYELSR